MFTVSWNYSQIIRKRKIEDVGLKYGFCKKLIWYKWTSDQLNTFVLTFFPDQHWSGQKVRKKVFNWSEVHLYRSNFLQNPHFRGLARWGFWPSGGLTRYCWVRLGIVVFNILSSAAGVWPARVWPARVGLILIRKNINVLTCCRSIWNIRSDKK